MNVPSKGMFTTAPSSDDYSCCDYLNDDSKDSATEIPTPESLDSHVVSDMATSSGHMSDIDFDLSKFSYLLEGMECESSSGHVAYSNGRVSSSPITEDFSNWLDFSVCSDSASDSLVKVTVPKPEPQQRHLKLEKNLNPMISDDSIISPMSAFFSDVKSEMEEKGMTANVVLGRKFCNFEDSDFARYNRGQEIPNPHYMPYSPSQWNFISSEFQKLWHELEDCVK
ncbi:hypothetical protein B0I72DRAFT_93965 [Yarrowia lipolytica]|jgi:hypothetical protein|nr:hypothetical protein B0I71DRAFT_98642 [Yarrowia lipolytica]RDW34212.1 hypothetical protein B0I72DRAFT_93965 [Yarrowia lipolytica]RDW37592.1 hypothetical protein B0I73DRAFT_102374 [Yarrowia lipolytica]RDW44902.1 hypothetical protein B0I74DRAFT_168998 [Yarrowia lipolytica]RDW50950.1 hypothetical protein B0I75DRAFT_122045 [Yarrowia lipolytica]